MRILQAAAAVAVIVSWASDNACAILICKGDVNLDAARDGADIKAFADAVISGSGVSASATWAADMDGSSAVDLTDVGPFVDCLLGAGGSACTTCFDPDIIDGINVVNGEHRIFVTSTTYNGNLGGYDGACAKCAARAAAAGLQLTYKAILSDGLGNARDRIVLEGGAITVFENVSGGLVPHIVVTSSPDLWLTGVFSPTLSSAIQWDEAGSIISDASPKAWTGSNSDGMVVTLRHCTNWTSSANINSQMGSPSSTNSSWLTAGLIPCISTTQHLYCISQ